MLEHGGVLALDHAFHEGLGRIVGAVVLAFIADSAGTLYLSVHALKARLLRPYLERGKFCFHCVAFVVVVMPQRYEKKAAGQEKTMKFYDKKDRRRLHDNHLLYVFLQLI
jgi:hypothetical protein